MATRTRALIIDCDPGIDDAIAIAMAAGGVEFDLQAITTTFGNVGVTATTGNALRVVDWLGLDLPVHAGSTGPLLGGRIDAAAYHGESGLEAPALAQSMRTAHPEPAVPFLIDALLSATEPVTIVALGPLTNLALALCTEPRITNGIAEVVVMGDGTDFGNDSPAAEFNALADPVAAQIVLESRVPVTLFGLNVTHSLIATPDRVAAIRALGTRASRIAADMITFFESVYVEQYGFAGAALHDPATIAYLLDPGMFEVRDLRVDVDTASPLSLGRAV